MNPDQRHAAYQSFALQVALMVATPGTEDLTAKYLTADDLPDVLSTLKAQIAEVHALSNELRVLIVSRAQEVYQNPRLCAQYMKENADGPPDRKRWRVYHEGQPVGYGATEWAALLDAIENAAKAPIRPSPTAT